MTVARRSLMAAAGAVAMLGAAGCREKAARVVVTDAGTAASGVRLTFFGNKYESISSEVLNDAIVRFERLHPGVAVTYQGIKGRAYYRVLSQRVAAGREDDLFFVDHDTAGELEARGAILDLNGVPEVAAYSPLMLEQMRGRSGVIRMLPTSIAAHGLFCNRALLEAKGFKTPKNWPEWKAQCECFLADGVTPVVANNDSSLKALVMGVALARYTRTGDIARVLSDVNEGRRKLSDVLLPGIRRALEFVRRRWVNAAAALTTAAAGEDLKIFARGESPFLLAGAPAASLLKKIAPQLRFVVVPHPSLSNGRVLVMKPDTRLAVSARCARREEAVALVRFLAQPENVERFSRDISALSPLAASPQRHLEEVAPIVRHFKEERPMAIMSDTRLAAPVCRIGTKLSELLLEGADEARCARMIENEAASWRRRFGSGGLASTTPA